MLCHLVVKENDRNDARTRMQDVINEWEAVSKTTGGALAPNKCWGWIISFDWDKDVWKYSVHDDSEAPMTVKNEREVVHNIETLQASQAKEMLGVQLAPDGNQKAQYEAMKKRMR